MNFIDHVFYKSSQKMAEIPDNAIDLIITSPPYFNIKDYAKNGYQDDAHSAKNSADLGSIDSYKEYIAALEHVQKKNLSKVV